MESRSAGLKQRIGRDERRRLIIKSATHVFSESSYQSATMTRVARGAGVSEALIYKHFPGKKQLFIATIEASAEYLTRNLSKIIREQRDRPLETVREIYHFYADLLNRDHDFTKMIFKVSSELDDPEIRRALKNCLAGAARIIAKALRSGQETGVIRRDIDTETAAWYLVGSYQFIALIDRLGGLEGVGDQSILGFISTILENEHVEWVTRDTPGKRKGAVRKSPST